MEHVPVCCRFCHTPMCRLRHIIRSETDNCVTHFVYSQRLPRVFFENNETMCLYCRKKIGDRDGVLSVVRLHEFDILINYVDNDNDDIDNSNFCIVKYYNIDSLFNSFSRAA